MPCLAFKLSDARKAWNHIRANMEVVERYGSSFEGKQLHTWDDGERVLCRCRKCGGFFLWQDSEFHNYAGDDHYYSDYFPVFDQQDAERLNRKYDGFELEIYFPGRFLVQDNDSAPHWK